MTPGEVSPGFAHLRALSDGRGVFEHARYKTPRRGHGYCVDDVARALIVLVREPDLGADLGALAQTCLDFVDAAIVPSGRAHNRMSPGGRFSDRPGVGDWWGRALWAVGVAGAHGATDEMRRRARAVFHRAATVRSADMRAMAFAALGAAEIGRSDPDDRRARALLRDAAAAIPEATLLETAIPDTVRPGWPWPEPRLRYANAVLPDALLAAGAGLGEPQLVDRGLDLMRFLLEIETRDGHFSPTGTRGRGPTECGPQFDQQPIEVATIAEACARAFDITGDEEWLRAVGSAWSWFCGDNDSGIVMFDPGTGAGFDGLSPEGRNENCGAESTLAVLSTYQQARRLQLVGMVPA